MGCFFTANELGYCVGVQLFCTRVRPVLSDVLRDQSAHDQANNWRDHCDLDQLICDHSKIGQWVFGYYSVYLLNSSFMWTFSSHLISGFFHSFHRRWVNRETYELTNEMADVKVKWTKRRTSVWTKTNFGSKYSFFVSRISVGGGTSFLDWLLCSVDDSEVGGGLSSSPREQEARLKWCGMMRGEQCWFYSGLWSCLEVSRDCAVGNWVCLTIVCCCSPEVIWVPTYTCQYTLGRATHLDAWCKKIEIHW